MTQQHVSSRYSRPRRVMCAAACSELADPADPSVRAGTSTNPVRPCVTQKHPNSNPNSTLSAARRTSATSPVDFVKSSGDVLTVDPSVSLILARPIRQRKHQQFSAQAARLSSWARFWILQIVRDGGEDKVVTAERGLHRVGSESGGVVATGAKAVRCRVL